MSGLFACVLDVELHLPQVHSLKAKRSVVKHLVETSRHRFSVAGCEAEFSDLWQRTRLGFAAVGSSADQVTAQLDRVERFVWSEPEAEVISMERRWMS